MACSKQLKPEADLRLVLVGQERVGKSSAGNTILRKNEFSSELSLVPLTLSSNKAEGEVFSRRVSVVDTPGLSSSVLPPEEVKAEIQRAVELSSPGPHVFLLTIQLGRFTEQEKRGMKILQEILGPEVSKNIMILFTYGDRLEQTGIDIDEFVQKDKNLQQMVQSCSGMYHVFNNNKTEDRKQVQQLMDKIDLLSEGGLRYYQREWFAVLFVSIKRDFYRFRFRFLIILVLISLVIITYKILTQTLYYPKLLTVCTCIGNTCQTIYYLVSELLWLPCSLMHRVYNVGCRIFNNIYS